MEKKKRKSEGRKSLNNIDAKFDSETNKLGFSPLTFIDNIVNTVHDIACDLVDDAERKLTLTFPNNANDIEKACDQLLDIWAPSLDRNFDKFEIYCLNNIFKIPHNIYTLENPENQRLKEINSLQEQYREQEKLLDTEIRKLQEKIQEEHYQTELLKEKLKYYDVKIPKLSGLSSEVSMNQQINELLPKLKEFDKLINALPATNTSLSFEKQNIEETFLHQAQDVNIDQIPSLLNSILSDK